MTIREDEAILLPLAGHTMPFLAVSYLNGGCKCGEITDGVLFEFRSACRGERREGVWSISRAALLGLLREIEATPAATAGENEEE